MGKKKKIKKEFPCKLLDIAPGPGKSCLTLDEKKVTADAIQPMRDGNQPSRRAQARMESGLGGRSFVDIGPSCKRRVANLALDRFQSGLKRPETGSVDRPWDTLHTIIDLYPLNLSWTRISTAIYRLLPTMYSDIFPACLIVLGIISALAVSAQPPVDGSETRTLARRAGPSAVTNCYCASSAAVWTKGLIGLPG